LSNFKSCNRGVFKIQLKDKIAIITGAGDGIGRETALLFAREGAWVVVADINMEAGQETCKQILDAGGKAHFFEVDVSKFYMVEKMVEHIVAKFGTIDILVNNAGITRDALLVKMTEENFDAVVEINLKGVYNCTRAVAPVMINKGNGKIINVSSIVGIQGNIGQTNYAAAKAGVIGMTKSWAKELGRKGINVNAVAPGFIVTDMTAKVPQKILDFMKERTPLGRLGKPRDVANALLFLTSDAADYINGVVLNVDGGLVF